MTECQTYSTREFSGDLCPILESALDPDAVEVVRRLRKQGHRAYLVGGCVRDLALGKIPKDFDVATSARPRQVKKVCRNSRIIGRRFRLVHVHFRDGKFLEVSTFRSDPNNGVEGHGSTEDGDEEEDDLLILRDNVFGTEEEDARRRDFTINGLFYDIEKDQILDYVGGVADLRKRVLRTIGSAQRRVREDPVRILRAIKFVTRLSLTLDPELAAAIAEYHEDLVRSAAPRVFEEILRMLGGHEPARSVELLARLGIVKVLVPELEIRPHAADEDIRLTRLLSRLRVMGEMDRGRRSFPTALYFAVLLYDEVRERLGMPGVSGRPQEAVEGLLRPFATRARLSRRDTARIRAMFQGLKRIDPSLAPSKKKRRRRRIPVRDLVRREYFHDALLLFRILSVAEDRDHEAVESWERRRDEFEQEEPTPSEAAENSSPPSRSRRRRRRRGRARQSPTAP